MKKKQLPAFPAMVKKVAALKRPPEHLNGLIRFVDMFCGIGGFHQAANAFGMECVFACDVDEEVRRTYAHNYGLAPKGDISGISADDVPNHDLFCAGFPCQPFSIIGKQRGFSDLRGTLFFEIVRILDAKRPRAVLLENVKQLRSNDKGRTFDRILYELENLGYHVSWKILNALHFGLPQKRERILIAAMQDKFEEFPWPKGNNPMRPLTEILEKKPDPRHYASEHIRNRRHAAHKTNHNPGIWHENKSGNVSSYPFSCALRAGASYNYLLVNGERRLTPREMLRLQGFPDSFEIICADNQIRKQAGNAVPIPLAQAGIEGIIHVIQSTQVARKSRLK